MLSNYLKIALRSLLRQKSYSAINIIGLAVGMACCLILGLYVREELRFDTDIPNADRIFRINHTMIRKKEGSGEKMAMTQFPLAPALKEEIPEVERFVRVSRNGTVLLANAEKKFIEKNILYADNGFFAFFPSEFIEGNPEQCLVNPDNIIISEDIARKYFGTTSALGQTLKADNNKVLTVSGVIKTSSAQRHIKFDAIITLPTLFSIWKEQGFDAEKQWFAFTNNSSYIQLKSGASVDAVSAKLPAFIDKRIGKLLERLGRGFVLDLQSISTIHLNPVQEELHPQGSGQNLRIAASIAVVILLLACINFMNLSTARSTRRAREVGMRKVFGAIRSQLVLQFLCESVVISFVALSLALVLVEAALPFVNSLLEVNLSVGYTANVLQLLVFAVFAFMVGVIAGTYPALVLSGFAPIKVLKGSFVRTATGATLRKSLVIGQFAISFILIVGTIIVLRQLDYTQNKSLGFVKEQVLSFSLPTDSAFSSRKPSMKAALKAIPGVVAVAGADVVPGDEGISQNPIGLEGTPLNQSLIAKRFFVDEDYISTMGLTMAQGRSFNASMTTDETDAFLINEAAVKALGLEKPMNTRLEWRGGNPGRKGAVIGVVKDFHFESLHTPITPAIFMVNKRELWRFVVRMNTNDIRGTMAQIETVWNQFAPNWVFDYAFVDENFGKLYKSEQRTSRIVSTFAILAIFIACLGLFGLAAFSAEVRMKEIGIRKVLGASVPRIIGILSKDFLQLVGIALVLATPLAYWLGSKWLQDFAYKIDISPDIFLFSGFLAVVVAFLTVAGQAWRAAQANPVQSLKSE